MPSKPSILKPTLWFLAGLSCLALSGVIAAGELSFALSGDATTGQVTAVEREQIGVHVDEVTGPSPNYRYRIRYEYAVAGKDYLGEDISPVSRFRKGQQVSVQFLAKDPDTSRLVDGWSSWVWLAVIVLLALK